MHVPFEHLLKSLTNVKEKTFFYIKFSSIATQTKKQKKWFFSISTLFVGIIYLFCLTQVCIFNFDFFPPNTRYDEIETGESETLRLVPTEDKTTITMFFANERYERYRQ